MTITEEDYNGQAELERRFNKAFAPFVGKPFNRDNISQVEILLRQVLDGMLEEGILSPTHNWELRTVVDFDKESGKISTGVEIRHKKLKNH